ncbi:hypothetical protein [Pseudomonas sp. 24 R 17]|nr:hypothetical protein [Pseudomonas sp. 24 R 17]CRM64786.1 hypothetical protein [Pseudomonas sp. 24 R 17]CRM67783.1 hypothetical protein [Pseudomonas sp. 24 R 17]
MFGLFLQVAVEVVNVGSALAVKPGFLLDQAVVVVLEPVSFADFVFDFGQQQPHVVVTVFDLGSVGVDAAANEVQAVGIFVTSDVPQFIAFGGDFSVSVIGIFTRVTTRQDYLD